MFQRSRGGQVARVDLAQGDHGKIRRILGFEIQRAGDARGPGRGMVGSCPAPDPCAKLLGRFLVALLGAVRYGQPNLIIAGRGAYGHEGLWRNLGGLFRRKVVKLDQQGRSRARTDDKTLLQGLGLAQARPD